MVMADAAFRLLQEREPETRVHVLAPDWSLPLIERMAAVERAIQLPLGHGQLGLGRRRSLGRQLAREEYDQAIVLPRSLKAALVPFFAGIPVRTGYRGEWRYGLINDIRPFDPIRLDQTVRRFVALVLKPGEDALPAIPEPRLRVDAAAQSAARERLGLTGSGAVAALMPGAEYGPAKRWPIERFAELARRLTQAGASVWVLGSAGERALGAQIEAAAGAGVARNLCGETSLAEVIDLLAAANVAISNDSGLMHVAAAVGTFVVAIYGSSSPAFTPPLTQARAIEYLELDCSPCFARECPLGHLRCLRGIEVEVVAGRALEQLGRVH
jgi:heptosyltransferase-2